MQVKQEPQTLDIAKEKREQLKNVLKQLLPEAMSEDKIDFAQLKRALGESVEPDSERFGLNWHGKAECFKTIKQQACATLKPCREESVDFDNTENLFIEGDNLEVLKLLQKSYSNKVKMIYIDPPYNTGKDFIYADNYGESLDSYLNYTKQKDEYGHKFTTNTESDGRYYSKWLNMMYPRLYLAKSLLREDGVIFISIDDHEQHHLRLICDQIFGEENFVSNFVWNGKSGGADDKYIRNTHEYLLCYARNKIKFIVGEQRIENETFPKFDHISQRYYKTQLARKWGANSKRTDRPNLFYSIQAPDNTMIFPMISDTEEGCWRWSETRMREELNKGNIEFVLDKSKWIVYEKIYQPLAGDYNTKKYSSWLDYGGNTAQGTKELSKLMEKKIFDFPKPILLLYTLISVANSSQDDIVLDFFSGSSTTAHAVMQLNAEDGGTRKYIMVQLPEHCAEMSEAYRAGYKTIADIGIDRIKRAATKIQQEKPDYQGDMGFKLFKLDKSNFKVWDGAISSENEFYNQLELNVEHVETTSTDEEILYEIMIDCGLELTSKVSIITLSDKQAFSLQDGKLLICLEKIVTEKLVNELLAQNPDKVIFLDKAFQQNDELKINTLHNFKNHAVNNIEKEVSFIVF